MKTLLICILISTQLVGCGFFPKRTADDKNPLILTECPSTLPELTDPTFGGTVQKMVEWANIYFNCRAAATAGAPPSR